jgi:hypothetical protein
MIRFHPGEDGVRAVLERRMVVVHLEITYVREKGVVVNLDERSKGWFEDQGARYG